MLHFLLFPLRQILSDVRNIEFSIIYQMCIMVYLFNQTKDEFKNWLRHTREHYQPHYVVKQPVAMIFTIHSQIETSTV